jgi:hypothetical protein
MSTLEAIAGAISALGEPAAAGELLTLHALAVERVLRLKGMWDPSAREPLSNPHGGGGFRDARALAEAAHRRTARR